MMKEKEIEKIIASKIETDENLGESSGSSGHKSFVSYEINSLYCDMKGDNFEIGYRYTLTTETEFTCYPDNPPYKESYEKDLVVDGSRKIIEESEKRSCRVSDEDDWPRAQVEINAFLEEWLAKLEWHYGANRAPVKYPPKYYMDELDPFRPYVCELEDMDGNPIRLNSPDPETLVDYVKEDLPLRFNMFL